MAFRAFSGIRLGLFYLTLFEGESACFEAYEVWHIRSVVHAFEDADSASFYFPGLAEVYRAQRPHPLAHLHHGDRLSEAVGFPYPSRRLPGPNARRRRPRGPSGLVTNASSAGSDGRGSIIP